MRYKVSFIKYNVGSFDEHIFLYRKTLTDKLSNTASYCLGTIFSIIPGALAALSDTIRKKRKPYSKTKDEKLTQIYRKKTASFCELIAEQAQAIKMIEEKYEAKKKDAWKSARGMRKIEKTMLKPSVVWKMHYLEEELLRRNLISSERVVLNVSAIDMLQGRYGA